MLTSPPSTTLKTKAQQSPSALLDRKIDEITAGLPASPEPKIKLEAMKIVNDCYKYIMELVTNGSVITDAIKHVTQLQNNVNIINKCDKSLEASESEEEVTTNGVF